MAWSDAVLSSARPGPARRALRKFGSRLGGLYAFLLLFVAVLVSVWLKQIGPNQAVAMGIGGLVGCIELLGRYRYAPVRAALSIDGLAYVAINMVAALGAYFLLVAFKAFETYQDPLKTVVLVLTAGFGSLAAMRSSIFKVRVGESDIGIGPSVLLDTLLLVIDRGVDRREAVARAQDVADLVTRISDPVLAANILTRYSLALMQNVDAKTTKEVSDHVTTIMTDQSIPDTIKMDIVALRIGIVVGPDVLEAAIAALGDRLPTIPPSRQTSPMTAEALKEELEKRRGQQQKPPASGTGDATGTANGSSTFGTSERA